MLLSCLLTPYEIATSMLGFRGAGLAAGLIGEMEGCGQALDDEFTEQEAVDLENATATLRRTRDALAALQDARRRRRLFQKGKGAPAVVVLATAVAALVTALRAPPSPTGALLRRRRHWRLTEVVEGAV